MQFDRHARSAQSERVTDGLVAEDVQPAHLLSGFFMTLLDLTVVNIAVAT
jgi:hypothetical protein